MTEMLDTILGKYIAATQSARNEFIDAIRSLHISPFPEAREDARLVLRMYVEGLMDTTGTVYRVSEDETLDKLGFGEPPKNGDPWASGQSPP